MANPEHVKKLQEGVEAWNKWREDNPTIIPDLSKITIQANLRGFNFAESNLKHSILSGCDLFHVWFQKADLQFVNLQGAFLSTANLREAKLQNADLRGVDLSSADLSAANLENAKAGEANLINAKLIGAVLCNADLSYCNLTGTVLYGANLSGCRVFGISAWGVFIDERTLQEGIVITQAGYPPITVDNLEIAQFIYLLLNNSKLRSVIDTLTTKSVLILGRFTPERKAVLDGIREALRKNNYVPILFDFEKPTNRNFSETVMTLASLSRFIIIDLSDPNSSPYEALLVSERLRSVPLQGIFCPTEGHANPFPMYADLQNSLPHVLPIFRYETADGLIAALEEHVIKPAEEKVEAMRPPK